jgi:hypothetical protein
MAGEPGPHPIHFLKQPAHFHANAPPMAKKIGWR